MCAPARCNCRPLTLVPVAAMLLLAAACYTQLYPATASYFNHLTFKVRAPAARALALCDPCACQCVVCACVSVALAALASAVGLGLGGAVAADGGVMCVEIMDAQEHYPSRLVCVTTATCCATRSRW